MVDESFQNPPEVQLTNLPPDLLSIQTLEACIGGFVKTLQVMRNIVGSAGLIFMGYLVVMAIPEVKRYIKMSTM